MKKKKARKILSATLVKMIEHCPIRDVAPLLREAGGEDVQRAFEVLRPGLHMPLGFFGDDANPRPAAAARKEN